MCFTIKPLEWETVRERVHDAVTFYGVYSAFEVQEGYTYLSCYGQSGKLNLGDRWSNNSLDEAKAAAQQDYEQRILSALETKT